MGTRLKPIHSRAFNDRVEMRPDMIPGQKTQLTLYIYGDSLRRQRLADTPTTMTGPFEDLVIAWNCSSISKTSRKCFYMIRMRKMNRERNFQDTDHGRTSTASEFNANTASQKKRRP